MKHTTKFLSLLLALLCLLSLAGCATPQGDVSPSDPPVVTPTPTEKEIIITLDNWSTYFDFVEKEEAYKNEYNETVHIKHYYSLVLKEGYIPAEKRMDIAVEYSFHEIRYNVQEDLINKKIVWGESFEESDRTEEITINWPETFVSGENFIMSGTFKSKCSDFKVLRIYGTLFIME